MASEKIKLNWRAPPDWLRRVTRQHRLLERGSSSTEAAEELRTVRAQLAAQLEQIRAQETAAARQLQVPAAQEAQAEATLAAQKASLAIAKINLGNTSIVAPQDGVLGGGWHNTETAAQR